MDPQLEQTGPSIDATNSAQLEEDNLPSAQSNSEVGGTSPKVNSGPRGVNGGNLVEEAKLVDGVISSLNTLINKLLPSANSEKRLR